MKDVPLKIKFERIMRELDSEWTGASPLPTNSEWHHFLVPGVIMSSLRNIGYSISDKDVEESISRGGKFAGGSCGFMGTCGGAYSIGIVASIIKKQIRCTMKRGQESCDWLQKHCWKYQSIPGDAAKEAAIWLLKKPSIS